MRIYMLRRKNTKIKLFYSFQNVRLDLYIKVLKPDIKKKQKQKQKIYITCIIYYLMIIFICRSCTVNMSCRASRRISFRTDSIRYQINSCTRRNAKPKEAMAHL